MLNKIFIMGRLTRDPELRYTQTGVPVASFTLAVDRDYKSDDGEKQTDFIDCAAWRALGEFIQRHFRKGSMAIVIGRLQLRDWEDKDGNKRRSSDIKVESIYFGESKKPERSAESPGYAYTPDFHDLGDYEGGEHPF